MSALGPEGDAEQPTASSAEDTDTLMPSTSSSTDGTFTGLAHEPESLRHRRELAYLAAARRMGQNSDSAGQ